MPPMTFAEFRVLLQPDVAQPGQWTVRVENAPRANFIGNKPPTTPAVLPPDLAQLRNPMAKPSLAQLRQLGQRVLDSLLPPVSQVELDVCLRDALNAGGGLRLVVSILGNAAVPNGIGCHELPVEALWSPKLDFLATNVRTPISRGITVVADRPPVRVAPPLKILVVASEPSDMPPVLAQRELDAIRAALDPLIRAGAVEIDLCTPPTADILNARLQQQKFHIVHFIGHGDFDRDGPDPSPQPYLYFEDNSAKKRRVAVDAEQMYTMLRNGNVPLIVMTACSTAAVQRNGPEYPGLAFEGLAQTLVERISGPLAAVAMQFDLETDAAGEFSRTLYQQLLAHDRSIDSAVAAARAALVAKFTAGHRSWVNPTVYWRCIDGKLFDLISTTGTLTPEQERELMAIDLTIKRYEIMLQDITRQPQAVIDATASLRAQWLAEMDQLMLRRGAVLGDSVRLRGGRIAADGTVQCELTLQLRSGARIGTVRTAVAFDPAEFAYVNTRAGNELPAAAVLTQSPGPGGESAIVLVQNASNGQEWAAGEHVLAIVTLRALNTSNGQTRPLYRIPITQASVARNEVEEPRFGKLDGIVFSV